LARFAHLKEKFLPCWASGCCVVFFFYGERLGLLKTSHISILMPDGHPLKTTGIRLDELSGKIQPFDIGWSSRLEEHRQCGPLSPITFKSLFSVIGIHLRIAQGSERSTCCLLRIFF
jgi:hypothetical protein